MPRDKSLKHRVSTRINDEIENNVRAIKTGTSIVRSGVIRMALQIGLPLLASRLGVKLPKAKA